MALFWNTLVKWGTGTPEHLVCHPEELVTRESGLEIILLAVRNIDILLIIMALQDINAYKIFNKMSYFCTFLVLNDIVIL